MTAITYLILSGYAAVGLLMACTWLVSLFYRDESEAGGELLLGFALYSVAGLFGVGFFVAGVSWHTFGIVLASLAFGVGLLGAACVIGLAPEWRRSREDREWAKLSRKEKWARYAQLAEREQAS